VDLSPEQTTRNVYLFNVTSGYLSVLDDTLGEPNGIALSPDESILYVTDSSALEANYGLPGAPLGDDGHRTVYRLFQGL
jgi:sugar lactone lactonase YvrE